MRGLLYLIGRLWGDAQAIKRNRVGKRIARRVLGRAAGLAIRKIVK